MRKVFIHELVNLARQHPQIALIVGDLGYSVIEPFVDEFPDRFVNAGVAEQNMTSLAAGMASEGYHVFTYSIANFPTFRCAEQIRNDVDYHRLPVTIVSVGGGLAYGALGYSHHAVQDYALMRSLPNMLIASPGDSEEVRACLKYLINNPGPSYLRMGKIADKSYHTAPPTVSPGRWLKIRSGTCDEGTILTTGAVLELAVAWTKTERYKNYSIHTMPLWSMMTKRDQPRQLHEYRNIMTLEDHLFDGGFGSWLLESNSMSGNTRANIQVIALDPSICGAVGGESYLQRLAGISPI